MSSAQLIREVRRSRRLSQRALAAKTGFVQSALGDIERGAHDTSVGSAEKLLRGAGFKLFALPTTSSAVSTWADLIYDELRGPRQSLAVACRALIAMSDELAGAEPALRVALCITPPPPCGDSRFDAALAGIVAYHLERERLPVPGWVTDKERFLSETWVVSPHTEVHEVPEQLKRHGVLLAESELLSV